MMSESLKICVLLTILLLSSQSFVKGQCNDTGISRVQITSLNNTVNFHLPNHQNLSHQFLNITYSWDVTVPEDSILDGFIYCFIDVEKNTLENYDHSLIGEPDEIDYSTDGESVGGSPFSSVSEEDLLGEFLFNNGLNGGDSDGDGDDDDDGGGNLEEQRSSIYEDCEHYVGGRFWVTDRNGTFSECVFPCIDELDQNCVGPYPSACLHLRKDCRPLPRHQRNVTLSIEYGREYRFGIYPYAGQSVSVSETHILSPAVFCVHHHLENHNVADRESVFDWCTETQTIAKHYLVTGPPSGLQIVSRINNYDANSFIITISWGPPHDIIPGATITHYSISAPTSVISFEFVSLEELNETAVGLRYFRNLTYDGIDAPRNHLILVEPKVIRNTSDCIINVCEMNGQPGSILFSPVVDFDPCSNNTISDVPYCDDGAVCLPRDITKQYLANCNCTEGFVGNGFNPDLLSEGTGCQDLDRCAMEPFLCSDNADCVDAPAPSLGIESCTCRSAYIGDGYVNGTGCVHIAIICFISLVGLIAILAGINGAIYLRRRFKNKMLLSSSLSRFVSGNTGTYTTSLPHFFFDTNEKPEPVFGDKYEINRSDLSFQEIIGRGNFGVVHKATLFTGDGEKTVAVKSLTGVYTTDYKDDFMAEINLLLALGNHENILSVVGVCTLPSDSDDAVAQSPLMITEFMVYGDLLHFLWDSRDVSMRAKDPVYDFTELSLYTIGRQVAHGLDFLANSKIIHGDVAARNMLVGEGLNIKISDFGLANDVYRYGMIKGATERRVPFKWISPERMTGGTTPITWRSDVWSFGVLLFEMVTLGAAPYPSMSPAQIYQKLQSGYRIPQPSSCSNYLYTIMKCCWCWTPYQRPSFKDLENQLSKHLGEENFVSRIEVSGEINQSNYEMEIGRRDNNDECADILTNGHINMGETGDESSSSHVTVPNGLTNGQVAWKPWSGDVHVRSLNDDEHQQVDDAV